MINIRKKIKKVLHAKSIPDFIYQVYFDRLVKKKRGRLDQMLQQGKNLVEQMDNDKRDLALIMTVLALLLYTILLTVSILN